MKTLAKTVWMMLTLLAVLTACSNDDEVKFSAEQLKYFEENRAYIREKKAAKDDKGELIYKEVLVGGDTCLYRVLQKEGTETKYPLLSSMVTMKLKGNLINGTNFQPETDMTYQPQQLIPGLAYVMKEISIGEKTETIIPATLAYGYTNKGNVPAGSTLVFTFTMNKIK